MSKLKLYRDSDDAPRAKGEDTTVLARFLESDIQDDVETCDELIHVLKDYSPEQRKRYDFVGNSFALSFADNEVTLECHALEDANATRLSQETLLEALEEWKAFIQD
ncbi:MAG TPA: hypothetical protein ENJ35_10810 [Gammaproteobacteria bacterium]|nr:hypothetical protein [Gammaproteobacteria bacterium]